MVQNLFAAENIFHRHRFVGLVGQFQAAGAIGHAIVIVQKARNDGGIGAPCKKSDCGFGCSYFFM